MALVLMLTPVSLVIAAASVGYAAMCRRPYPGAVGLILWAAVAVTAYLVHARAWGEVFEAVDAGLSAPAGLGRLSEVAATVCAATTFVFVVMVVRRHRHRRRHLADSTDV